MTAAVESLSQLGTRAKALAVAGAMVAMFTAAMDQTLVGTAMPRIVGSLGGLGLFPWVFTAYMVSSTTVVPIVGRLTDMYGRKPFYLAGIAVLVAGSMLAGLSSSMPQLIAFRALQGIGGGMVMGITFIVAGDLFPPAERSKYVGLFTGVFAAASVLGPLIGGALTDYVHWRWVFYVNLPLGALAMLAVAVSLPAVRPIAQGMRPDWWGFALLPALVVPLLLAFSWGGSRFDWLSLPMASMFGAVAFLLVLFVLAEGRAVWPVLPLSLMGNHVFAVAAAISFLLGTSMFGAISFIPMFVQGVLGASATNSGLITMPLTVALALSSTLGGQVIARLGRYKLVNLLGLAVVTLAVYLFSQIGVTTARAEVTRNMVILGTGMGLTLPVLTLAVQNAVPYRMLGIATSSIQFIRQVGAVMGVALLGSRLNAVFAHQLAQGMPPELRSMPPEMSSVLRNPDFFLSPQRMAALQERFAALGENGMELFEALLGTVRLALASGIAEAFGIALLLSLPSLALGLLLKEIPLRKVHVVEPERPVLPAQAMALQGFGDGPSPPDPAPPQGEAELRREVAALREQVAYLRQMAHRRAQAPPPTSLHQEMDALRQELRLLAQELCRLAPGASSAQEGSEEWPRLLEEILREVRSLRESLQVEWRRRLMQH